MERAEKLLEELPKGVQLDVELTESLPEELEVGEEFAVLLDDKDELVMLLPEEIMDELLGTACEPLPEVFPVEITEEAEPLLLPVGVPLLEVLSENALLEVTPEMLADSLLRRLPELDVEEAVLLVMDIVDEGWRVERLWALELPLFEALVGYNLLLPLEI